MLFKLIPTYSSKNKSTPRLNLCKFYLTHKKPNKQKHTQKVRIHKNTKKHTKLILYTHLYTLSFQWRLLLILRKTKNSEIDRMAKDREHAP